MKFEIIIGILSVALIISLFYSLFLIQTTNQLDDIMTEALKSVDNIIISSCSVGCIQGCTEQQNCDACLNYCENQIIQQIQQIEEE